MSDHRHEEGEATPIVRTVGHGTLSEAELIDLLHAAGVRHVVDVRSFPSSHRSPQFGRERLERWLPDAGIGYSWDQRLGGRRRGIPNSPNVAWRQEAFRAYADYMATASFHAGLDDLVELASTTSVAVMCAESVWWRCHRRLLADALVVLRTTSVEHLFHDGRTASHQVTVTARRVDDELVYDLGGTSRLL